jgi:hypothetical protein
MAKKKPSSSRAKIASQGDATIGGDVVGGDKIIHNTWNVLPNAEKRRAELPHLSYFFGREAELKRIAEALDPEALGWGVLIDGPGGIGKTALAIRAGQQAQRFATHIFLSAKTRELTPAGERPMYDFRIANFSDLLLALAHELGELGLGQATVEELANAVRLALANRQALLIFDNIETFAEPDQDRLFQFLKRLPRSCKAIVTSRRRADTPAEVIRLTPLQAREGAQLLEKLAALNPALQRATQTERQQLVEAADGNPLLIEWIAGQLDRPGSRCRTVAEARRYLREAPPGNDPLEYVFRDMLAALTPGQSRILAALSHLYVASANEIAEVSGLTEAEVQAALEELTARSFLKSDDKYQQFTLPPIPAGLFAQRQPEAVKQVGERYGVHLSQRFEKLVTDSFKPGDQADLADFLAGWLGEQVVNWYFEDAAARQQVMKFKRLREKYGLDVVTMDAVPAKALVEMAESGLLFANKLFRLSGDMNQLVDGVYHIVRLLDHTAAPPDKLDANDVRWAVAPLNYAGALGHFRLGNRQAARPYAQRAVELFREQKSPHLARAEALLKDIEG